MTAAVVGAFTATPPAQAGGWAVAYVDPLPATIEAGKSYTVGYWVLQHGSHPYEGDLGVVGLKIVDERGQATTFAGVRLPEAAHYASAMAVPHTGRWQLIALQGVFAEYPIGTLTAPGQLVVAPTPTPMAFDGGHQHTWGAIRPPMATTNRDGTATNPNDLPPDSPAAAALPTTPRRGTAVSWMTAAAVGTALLFGAGLLVRRPVAGVVRAAWRSRHRRGVRAA